MELGKIVKFECGCIGTLPKPGQRMIMFSACDRDNESEIIEPWLLQEDSIRADGLLKKTWKELPDSEAYKLIEDTIHLVYDGYRYRKAKRLLRD